MDIIEEIRTDPEKGARRLEREYKARLMAVALDVCKDVGEAEALVFDTLGDTVHQIESLVNPKALFSWMCRLLVSRHNRATRRKSADCVTYSATLPEPPPEDVGVDRVIQEVDGRLLHEAIDRLPPKLKEAVLLRYFADMSISQIARFLMIPAGTVNSRLHIARTVLGMRLGVKLRKHAVAIAAILLLFAASAATVAISGYMGGDDEPVALDDSSETAKENTAMKTEQSIALKFGTGIRNILAAGSTLLAVMQGQAATLYFAPSAEDNALSWDNAGGWKIDEPPYGFVNRLPTEADDVTLNASKISLAGQGIESPHALLVTNGVNAVAKSIKVASADASLDASYAKSGRVIGVQIEEGGFLHTADDFDALSIGESAAGYGVLTMNGGMISNRSLCVGQYGIGVMTNAGGWVQMSANDSLVVGNKAGSRGTLAMSSGVITHNRLNWSTASVGVGVLGEGTFELSGGVVSNRILVGNGATGRGTVKMSGGQIVNRVFVGTEASSVGEFDFTGGEIRGHIYVGNRGRGRMTFDGGRHYCEQTGMQNIVPDYTDASRSHGLIVGNQAGSYGELIVKKPGLTFYSGSIINLELLCGYLGEGHVKAFVDLEIPYLRVGGNTDSVSSYVVYAATTTTVVKAAYAGGYPLAALDGSGTFQYPGFGEIVLSNAVLRLTRNEEGNTTPQLHIGRHADGFGVLRGCGAVHGATWNANSVRMVMGNGQIIGDGFGEQRTLDLNTVISVTNLFTNADDGTNGWYAVNKGAVLFPRVYMSTASDTRIIGSWTRQAAPDFVNSVGFSVSGVQSTGNGYDLRGGVFAADRNDVHADTLPKSGSVVGIWKLGLFTNITDFTPKSFQNMDLTFRYDHTKVIPGQPLVLYRWNGSAWSRVASAKATNNPRISCTGLAPISGETYNVGTFALLSREIKGFQMIVR